MSTELIINASLPETRIALMENGEIQDLLIERASGKGITGNIYKGRVTRVLPGMQAAFVDIGLEKAAFLYVDDVYVHNEIFEEDEESTVSESAKALAEVTGGSTGESVEASAEGSAQGTAETEEDAVHEFAGDEGQGPGLHEHDEHDEGQEVDEEDDQEDSEDEEDSDDDENDDDEGPVEMSAEGGEGDDEGAGSRGGEPAQSHPGTIAPASSEGQSSGGEGQQAAAGSEGQGREGAAGEGEGPGRRRHRRGRRGGRFRSRNRRDGEGEGEVQPQGKRSAQGQPGHADEQNADYPAQFVEQVSETGASGSDRAGLSAESGFGGDTGNVTEGGERRPTVDRHAFRSQRSKDRRVPSRMSRRSSRPQVNIQDLLKEGQEVIVQVAKDPIATKGARLTCHISLPGRHLVCMPTIDHVGVSRRIERDDERRKLRDIVERNRPRNLGFIVRTASGRGQAEKRIQQDIDYLTNLWNEIREKAGSVTAPALVYEDLNSVLRAIRDWVTEDIDKIIVDSRYHYNDILRFVSHFMPSLKQKVELYHGDIPIFDAYNISTELSRALERKVWLKSGGYLVIDQAEALVAIDVNTGRFVGKKNLEDTILKTNLEAVQEIAYQLRLRNCGGIIILDLIDMEKEENKQRVYRALEEALKRDRARPSILKISELGLVEMTRKRTRDTIVRALCESCSFCEGKGFIKSKATVAYEALREIEREVIERDVSKIMVQAHPEVIDILAIEERETLDQIERRYRKQIYLQAMTDFHPEQFEVAGDKKPGKKAGEFSEVVQGLRGASAHEREHRDRNERGERGGSGERSERGERGRGGGGRDRDRGRRGGRGRDRDRGGRDQRDRDPDQQPPRQFGPGTIIVKDPNRVVEPKQVIEGEQNVPFTNDQQPDFQRQPGEQADSLNGSGNEAGSNLDNGSDGEPGNSFGNGSIITPRAGHQGPHAGEDDFFENEEDRLAFLRAQAAQDAALARLSSGQSPGHQGRGGQGVGRGGGDRGRGGAGAGGGAGGRGRRGRRGGTGGKFRGGRDQRDFGPRGGGRGGHGSGNGGGQGGGFSGGSSGGSAGGEGSSGGGGASGGSEGGGGSGAGGGGDHSSPPTV